MATMKNTEVKHDKIRLKIKDFLEDKLIALLIM